MPTDNMSLLPVPEEADTRLNGPIVLGKRANAAWRAVGALLLEAASAGLQVVILIAASFSVRLPTYKIEPGSIYLVFFLGVIGGLSGGMMGFVSYRASAPVKPLPKLAIILSLLAMVSGLFEIAFTLFMVQLMVGYTGSMW
jgi:hypothetical protein